MSLITRTDVTAVKFYNNLILAGIGSTVNVFDRESMKLLQRLFALNGQKIYGFMPSKCGEKILVFGGKQYTVVSRKFCDSVNEEKEVFYRLFEPVVCDDWIHSALWVNEEEIAVLTAHNVVQKWNTTTPQLLSNDTSKDNSILYSGLLLPLVDGVLVMAGTVFSEVIVHKCGDGVPLHNLKGHKGVIFSISCKPENNIIVTTSDDRSVCIWGPDTIPIHNPHTTEYWQNINIVRKHEVYGHLARVMRSCITNNLIVSVGEDSAICYWNYEGKLIKKVLTHQNGCIWSVDANGNELVTGGGDCGVILHPLSIATDYSQNEVINISIDTPKKVEFTARRNLVITDENDLVYYDFGTKHEVVFKLEHTSTYKMLALSSCKQLIAVTDMTGKLNIFIEKCKDEAMIMKIVDIKLNIGKVLSTHWAGNRHLLLCTEDGNITVLASNNNTIEEYTKFILPSCKEASLTSAALDPSGKYFVVGDRSGNIHIFVKGKRDPVKSFSKVHGRYGPRSLVIKNNCIISTGRDHSVKYFSLNKEGFKFMSNKDLPFAWVEKFLDKEENLVCGFQERVFVVYNLRENSKLLEISCGGGHRSFDAVRFIEKIIDRYEEVIQLVYLKDSDVNIARFELSKIVSRNVVNGSHAKEINCMKTHTFGDNFVYITGGEDTTLRISIIDKQLKFQDVISFKHLSSIRTLKTYFLNENTFLLISAGGRAQICIKKVTVISVNNDINIQTEELIDYLIKGTDKERKGNQTWRNCNIDFDPEMRIMDLEIIENEDKFIIFAVCSDAFLRIFTFKINEKKLTILSEVKYHTTCILKTKYFKYLDRDILITATTRGEVAFWDVTTIDNLDNPKDNIQPFFVTKTNKSGINSLFITAIEENKVIFGTAGDDNSIHTVLLETSDQNNLSSTKILSSWHSSKYHSSQITGLCIVDNYILSASIDQRVTLFKWGVKEESIECVFLNQMFSDVADVQGMEVIENESDKITVCVFSKGLEVMAVPKI